MSSCGKFKNEIGLLNVQERAREEQICRAFFLVVHLGGKVPEVILTKQNKLLGEEGRASLKQGPAGAVLSQPSFPVPPPHTHTQCSLFHGSSNSWSLCYDSATTHFLCRPSGQLSYCTSQCMCELVHSQDLMLETF